MRSSFIPVRLVLFAAIFSAALAFASLTGCAGAAPAPEAPSVALSPKDVLYLPLPAVADSVDSALGRLGWGGGRFAEELRKEVAYQFNRKGVAVTADSAGANSYLTLRVETYAQGRHGGARI